jgi:hypothetical protein
MKFVFKSSEKCDLNSSSVSIYMLRVKLAWVLVFCEMSTVV